MKGHLIIQVPIVIVIQVHRVIHELLYLHILRLQLALHRHSIVYLDRALSVICYDHLDHLSTMISPLPAIPQVIQVNHTHQVIE